MKLVYGTNIWSHHQIPVAIELAKILGPERFKMVIFEEVDDERHKMGWAEKGYQPWLIGPPQNEVELQGIVQECIEADVMVMGDCPPNVMRARIATGKLTLVASERLLKKNYHRLRLLNPRYALGIRQYRAMVNHPHVHALAIGHYAPDDLRKIGAFDDRVRKWGYFIDIPSVLPAPHPERPLKLLWCGRMLKWKRVDLLLHAVDKLKNSGCISECLIVGDGPEHHRLLEIVRRFNLIDGIVRFSPSVAFSDVRRLMRESDVYVLTSNRSEGWGAVAGEAMAEGCILVANENAGSSQELVVNGVTGLLFKDGDAEDLSSCIELLGHNYSQKLQMRQLAWERVNYIWSPAVAAERLVALIRGLLVNRPPDFAEGPCSLIMSS